MSWWNQLDKTRGSRPRSVLMMNGDRETIAKRLTILVNHPHVKVRADDLWMPTGLPIQNPDGGWNLKPAAEAKLGEPNDLVSVEHQQKLRRWWLEVPRNANMPNWDIASGCQIRGVPGLLLVEAKAHGNELDEAGKRLPTSLNGWKNHERIGRAIADAGVEFQFATKKPWAISRDRHYQLSNRFAWSWKLTSLGIPVVLVYLGFLNASDMAGDGPLFRSEKDWTQAMTAHAKGVVPDSTWTSELDFDGVPLIPLRRVHDQVFDPETKA